MTPTAPTPPSVTLLVLGFRARAVALAVTSVVAGVAVFEAVLWSIEPSPVVTRTGPREGSTRDHPLLGYAPTPNTVIDARAHVDGRELYSVTYTIDERGLRVSPPAAVATTRCAVFFGGSFTFGEDVGDTETMPYQVGLLSAGTVEVYNFGVSGYGPHQMLSALEHGLASEIVTCEGRIDVIYTAVPDHVRRSVGLADWDRRGPRYRLDRHGGVALDGRFDDGAGAWLYDALDASRTWSRLFGRNRPLTADDIELFVRIVSASRSTVERAHGADSFHVLYWSDPEIGVHRRVRRALGSSGVALHDIGDVIPDFHARRPKYLMHPPLDLHPSARAHALVARYVLNEIL